MAGEMAVVRVRQLIAESGLTQAEFAAKAGLDAPKISKSLSGVRRFTSLDLARIANVGGVTVDWLLGAETTAPSMATRISAAPRSPADMAVQEAERFAQIWADLAYLGYGQNLYKIPPVPKSGRPVDQGRQLAARALDHFRSVGGSPYEKRDLAEAVEEVFGIDVAIVRLPDGFDGLTWVDDQASLIIAGTSRFPARQRFTIAHELGHILAGDDQKPHLDANLNDVLHKQQSSETRANAFAAEFLLPEEVLREEAGEVTWSDTSFAELACRLWVSPSTLAWRLFSLGLIDRQLCDSFRRLNTAEAAHLAGAVNSLAEWIELASRPRTPAPLIRTTFQAYADGKATLRPFANLIGVESATLRQALNEEREESPLAS
ncbi:XRE family transcriptional regulator [Streptosporangium sp. NBC_01755]|uniref:helix-turn-helix domain-containing protein n=1 Tax=unclassified Streptosporangium TaxID=2632669 RepID=UPI002DD82240|nr:MULTISPECIES: XRE family transcriptional regulator [unclassified Streptosporangium]WSA26203.1 XRE family transcriptional regulator [Streptosporangium sp. NBC_01810]WSD02369.1 XRE family transcriptional regulator [Streptosporangium sp. NBC_01755]